MYTRGLHLLFVSCTAGFIKLTKDCSSAYATLKLLSAPPKSQLISEFFEFPTDVSQTTKVLCCSTKTPNGFPSDKKKSDDITVVPKSLLLPRPECFSGGT